MPDSNETAITEITIATDGRIYVFGLSKEVLGILASICPDIPVVEDRVRRVFGPDQARQTNHSTSVSVRDRSRRCEPGSVRRDDERLQS